MKPCNAARLVMLLAACAGTVAAQDNADVLAKQLSNPVASLVSVPLQLNTDFGFDGDGTRTTLNVQPVYPTALNEKWNLITRVILPVLYQDGVISDADEFGLGDTTPTFFFSPRAETAGGWIWGVGPVFLLPTATDGALGAEKWGVGPSALALKQTQGGLTFGALVNHIESVAGTDRRADVSSTFLQPFFAKQFAGGRTFTINSESTYDWETEQWTVPVNLVYSKVTKLGGQMVSVAGGGRVYLEAPDGGPEWGVRLAVTLLYPQR